MAGDKPYVRVAGLPFAAQSPEQAEQLTSQFSGQPMGETQAQQAAEARQNLSYVDENWGTAGKAGMGLASGITLGLGPAALSAMGVIDPGHLSAAQQSGSYLAGDIAGMILPTLFSGGEGALARAAGATPAGMLARMGSGAERLAARVLPETTGAMGSLGASAIKMMARGSAEGALINMSHTVSDHIIQDAPLTASAIAASGVDGALFGGLAGGSIGLAGGLLGHAAAGAAGRLGGRAESRVLRELGAGVSDVSRMQAEGGGEVIPSLKSMRAIMESEGVTMQSGPKAISKAAKRAAEGFEATQKGIVETLQKEAPTLTPNIDHVLKRIGTEVPIPEHKAIISHLEEFAESKKSWNDWVRLREYVDNPKVKGIIDSELVNSIKNADAGLADQYSAAVAGAATAKHLSEMTASKAARDALGGESRALVSSNEMVGAGVGAALGHPASALGYLGGKAALRGISEAIQPTLAEIAYTHAISGEAAGTVAKVRTRIAKAVEGYVQGPRRLASEINALSRKKPSQGLTREKYEKELERTEYLISDVHKHKVQEYANQLAEAGHPDVAKELVALNGRASEYLQANLPMNRKAQQVQSLRKLPTPKGLDMKEFKFLRLKGVIGDPLSVLDKLENGSLSRDEVKALKYVAPALHQEIGQAATFAVQSLKAQGKYLEPEKICGLGLLLDAPVDRMLESDYVSAVQTSLKSTEPQQNAQQPPPQPANNQIDPSLLTPIDRQLIA